jgi:hypothetical protein
MCRQNLLSNEALDTLADLVGGQVLRFHNTSPVLRRMQYTIGGNPVDPTVVRELRDIRGESAIWPEHFDHLDDVPFRVTRAGYAYFRSLADA